MKTITRDIKVGDTIRSYDWEHRRDCYMEGVVTIIAENLYFCNGFKVVREGVEERGTDFRTPVESFFDYDGRIEKI